MGTTSYAIAIGSNRRGRHGSPEAEVAAAIRALGAVSVSPTLRTAPLGPSNRRFANAVAIVETAEEPPALLARLKAIERAHGRRRSQRWAARVIDLDIVLWSGGSWGEAGLTVPHPQFRLRRFVLDPLAQVAPDWRDPLTGRTVRQLRALLLTRRPLAPR
ncbi:2-amino-4-hydroxy-6-hydroxymethyldihydropteridine diphosphokinase [Sphingomonas sp. AOB5]|uniref:2-amino-4-hydroxy-6- hydroxymethyldihydropteridine diphosphokinase n=1 Tax=Sphingomonas sp. AOB5 TaxID=3034017 RepID=UPI0023F841E5|nr:2-amino-4-hydroxy-6-hydroxymethyldihydropteridine diphosphokinase [Sphingomonas sp. AOB5]MDF7775866.1 2-amino-4-hydroxy-6-hydroxymethyldihydropteridine diphosphokinase [Sphingomonas sp. AOB5]